MHKWFAFLLLLALFAVSVRAEEDLGEDSEDLQECLDGLAEDAFEVAQLRFQRDELYKKLDSLENEKSVFQWYRDNNRTEAMRCLKSLALCNDNNQWKEVDSNGVKRQPTRRDVGKLRFSNPLFDEEDAVIGALLARSTSDRDRHESKHIQHSRSWLECTLKECQGERKKSNFYQKDLRAQVTQANLDVPHLRNTVMAFHRFARLYQELYAECQVTLDVCHSGTRLLRITLTNTSARDWLRVWVGASATGVALQGFSSAIFTDFAEVGVDQVNQRFLENHSDGVSAHADADGSEVSLTLRVNPWTQRTISHLAVAAGPFVLGNNPVLVFDAQGNFILDSSLEKRDVSKRYNWPNLDCDATGHPLPFAEPHVKNIVSNVYWTGGAIEQSGQMQAEIKVEEVRFVVNYPSTAIDPQYFPTGTENSDN